MATDPMYSTRLEGNTFFFQNARLHVEEDKPAKPGQYDKLVIEFLGGKWELDPNSPHVHRLIIDRGKINGSRKDVSGVVLIESDIMPVIVGRNNTASSAPRADKNKVAIENIEVDYGPEMLEMLIDKEYVDYEMPKLKIRKGYVQVVPRSKMPLQFKISNPLVTCYHFTDLEGMVEDKRHRGSAHRVKANEFLIYSVHSPRFSFI